MTELTRRESLRSIAIGTSTLALGGTGTVAAASHHQEGDSNSERDGPKKEAMTGSSTSFTDYEISVSESAVLQSEWSFASPVIWGNGYQLDILIQSNDILKPETKDTTFNGTVRKDWVRETDPALGDVYHWKGSEYILDFPGASRMLDARIEPISQGTVEAKTGTFAPFNFWDSGTFTVE